MKSTPVVMMMTALILQMFVDQSVSSIRKRGLIDFARMIRAVTGRKAGDYDGYGRYCGLGGSGDPIDPVDRCCLEHDSCYEDVSNHQCYSYILPAVYMFHYKWSFVDGNVTCEGAGLLGDFLNFTECSNAVCNCDKTAVECFQTNPYDETNKRLPNYI